MSAVLSVTTAMLIFTSVIRKLFFKNQGVVYGVIAKIHQTRMLVTIFILNCSENFDGIIGI